MAGRQPVPPGIDITRPSIARVYDAFLDGKDNFAVDRAVVEAALQIAPDSAGGAKSNRAFLQRVVRYLAAEAGITQFVDIDFSRPVGLLMFAILHHITDAEDPAAITARFRDALAPGSYLAISSVRMPGPEHPEDAEKALAVQELFDETLGTGRWRGDGEILAWFGDWELLEPGLVPLPEWRPDTAGPARRDSTYHGFVGGVARKRQHPAGS